MKEVMNISRVFHDARFPAPHNEAFEVYIYIERESLTMFYVDAMCKHLKTLEVVQIPPKGSQV